MEARDITQKGNSLKATIAVVSNTKLLYTTETSQKWVINGVAVFQLRVVTTVQVVDRYHRTYFNLLFVLFTKRRVTDDLTYLIHFTSVELNIVDKTFTSDDGTWRLINENKTQQFTFNVAVEMQVMPTMPSASSFASLHGDTELTDFELRGEDGSVRVHRAVLAIASPVLRGMLGGAWRETAEGHVDVTGTSQASLEHLKNYIYLHTFPEVGLEQLLLLSSYYMMPELERSCVSRLVRRANAQNAYELIEFAAKNNMKLLMLAILECVQNGAISISEMRNHLVESK